MVDYVIRVPRKLADDPMDDFLYRDRCEQVTSQVPAGVTGRRCQLWRNHAASLPHAIRLHRDHQLTLRCWDDDPTQTRDIADPEPDTGQAAYWAIATYPAWNEERPIDTGQTTIGPSRRRSRRRPLR